MRILSFNANGIRSAANKGFLQWLKQQNADVVCLQETKAQPGDLAGDATFAPKGWHCFFNSAQKKGYAGVALFSREKPDDILTTLGAREFDDEGRYLEARFGQRPLRPGEAALLLKDLKHATEALRQQAPRARAS